MGNYEIVIGKKDGRIEVEGRDFSGLRCLEFLGKLKLGPTVEERLKTGEPHAAGSHLVGRLAVTQGDSGEKEA